MSGSTTPNSRSYLNRFISPDTIVPEPGGSQGWNRYSYVNNRPMIFTDPTGHKCAPDEDCETPHGDLLVEDFYIPEIISNWLEIKDNPRDLIARALMVEEGEKLLTGKVSDAYGAAWVPRNRYYYWYANDDAIYHDDDTIREETYWVKATTSGILGMSNGNAVSRALNIQGSYGYWGKDEDEAIQVYNVALDIAQSVLDADQSEDPVRGALYYSDGDAYGNFYNRTHFYKPPGYYISWCVPDATICN